MVMKDYSEPSWFKPVEQPPDKTIDIGLNGVSLSTNATGQILQLSTFHPEHGIVVASPFEQFDGSEFENPEYVRKYRARMLRSIAENKGGFGLDFGGKVDSVSIRIWNWNTAIYEYSLDDGLEVVFTSKVLKDGKIEQTATVTNPSSSPVTRQLYLNLCLSLNRASYGQLTERGPIALPPSRNDLATADYQVFKATNPNLKAELEANVRVDGKVLQLSKVCLKSVDDRPLDVCPFGTFTIQPNASVKVQAELRFTSYTQKENEPQVYHAPIPYKLGDDLGHPEWKTPELITTYMLRRNVDYILANCVIPVSEETVAVITDHVALPLGWNRDNYWQLKALFDSYKHIDQLVGSGSSIYKERILEVARGHLDWVLNKAERKHKFWNRSYRVTGKQKDGEVFQLDQQCYPLLEVCDSIDYLFPATQFAKDLLGSNTIEEILQYIESRRDKDTGLVPTDETPADDKIEFPYSFSNHVLLWRTYKRLRDTWKTIEPSNEAKIKEMEDKANITRDRALKSFATVHPKTNERIFAYVTDGKKYEFYHDANDIPTLLAEEWGFVETPEDISVWKNTMNFALSSANKEGFCRDKNSEPSSDDKEDSGKATYTGLGSRHSPGAWVLGYYQELAYAVMRDDERAITDVWGRIKAAMQWDGTFSEAVDIATAKCSSKAWFSWPGAMIGSLIIKMRDEGKEHYLLKET